MPLLRSLTATSCPGGATRTCPLVARITGTPSPDQRTTPMRLRALLVALALAAPVTALEVTPVAATVGGNCSGTWYYNSGGAYKLFTTCPTGTLHYAQRAKIICDNGIRYGVWQTQPGPYYGSTAQCASGGHATSGYTEFW